MKTKSIVAVIHTFLRNAENSHSIYAHLIFLPALTTCNMTCRAKMKESQPTQRLVSHGSPISRNLFDGLRLAPRCGSRRRKNPRAERPIACRINYTRSVRPELVFHWRAFPRATEIRFQTQVYKHKRRRRGLDGWAIHWMASVSCFVITRLMQKGKRRPAALPAYRGARIFILKTDMHTPCVSHQCKKLFIWSAAAR